MNIKLEEELIITNFEAKSKQEVIKALAKILREGGYVKDTFLNAILKREEKFPTGLPTLPEAIAIPHTDEEHCIQPAIAIAILKEPVEFKLMGDGENSVNVRAVFLLALKNKKEQPIFLSKFSKLIDNSENLKTVLYAKNKSEIVQAVKSVLI